MTNSRFCSNEKLQFASSVPFLTNSKSNKNLCNKFALSPAAYEQAFQLTDTDADRSCVLTAMGMVGYALNDKDGAKSMLFKR